MKDRDSAKTEISPIEQAHRRILEEYQFDNVLDIQLTTPKNKLLDTAVCYTTKHCPPGLCVSEAVRYQSPNIELIHCRFNIRHLASSLLCPPLSMKIDLTLRFLEAMTGATDWTQTPEQLAAEYSDPSSSFRDQLKRFEAQTGYAFTRQTND